MYKSIIISGLLTVGSIILFQNCTRQLVSDNAIDIIPVPEPSVQVTPVASIPSLNLGQSDDTGFLDKEVANLRAIPLETKDDCLIGRITDLFVVGDTLVVVDGAKAKHIYLFNLEGEYIRQFGQVGNGPGEYVSISSATVDNKGISIYDLQTNRSIKYDYSGNIIAAYTFTESTPVTVMLQNDSTFVATYASYFEKFPYALQWLNGDSIIATAFPYTINRDETAPSLFRLNENEIGFHIPYNDTVYSINGTQIVPLFTLGLIKPEESKEWLRKSATMNMAEEQKYLWYNKNAPAGFVSVYPAKDAFIITHQKGTTSYVSVVDRKTLTSRNYLQTNVNPPRIYTLPYIQSASGNTLCGYIAEDYFLQAPKESREFIEKHFSERDREILKNYDYENNNPIVWLVDLK